MAEENTPAEEEIQKDAPVEKEVNEEAAAEEETSTASESEPEKKPAAKKKEKIHSITDAKLKERLERAKRQGKREVMADLNIENPEDLADQLNQLQDYKAVEDERKAEAEHLKAKETRQQAELAKKRGEFDELELGLQEKIKALKSEKVAAEEQHQATLLKEQKQLRDYMIRRALTDAYLKGNGRVDASEDAVLAMVNEGVEFAVEGKKITVQASGDGEDMPLSEWVEQFVQGRPHFSQNRLASGSDKSPRMDPPDLESDEGKKRLVEEMKAKGATGPEIAKVQGLNPD